MNFRNFFSEENNRAVTMISTIVAIIIALVAFLPTSKSKIDSVFEFKDLGLAFGTTNLSMQSLTMDQPHHMRAQSIEKFIYPYLSKDLQTWPRRTQKTDLVLDTLNKIILKDDSRQDSLRTLLSRSYTVLNIIVENLTDQALEQVKLDLIGYLCFGSTYTIQDVTFSASMDAPGEVYDVNKNLIVIPDLQARQKLLITIYGLRSKTFYTPISPRILYQDGYTTSRPLASIATSSQFDLWLTSTVISSRSLQFFIMALCIVGTFSILYAVLKYVFGKKKFTRRQEEKESATSGKS